MAIFCQFEINAVFKAGVDEISLAFFVLVDILDVRPIDRSFPFGHFLSGLMRDVGDLGDWLILVVSVGKSREGGRNSRMNNMSCDEVRITGKEISGIASVYVLASKPANVSPGARVSLVSTPSLPEREGKCSSLVYHRAGTDPAVWRAWRRG